MLKRDDHDAILEAVKRSELTLEIALQQLRGAGGLNLEPADTAVLHEAEATALVVHEAACAALLLRTANGRAHAWMVNTHEMMKRGWLVGAQNRIISGT